MRGAVKRHGASSSLRICEASSVLPCLKLPSSLLYLDLILFTLPLDPTLYDKTETYRTTRLATLDIVLHLYRSLGQ